ncbi:bifunctional ADP-dependent (S)-NAD(P)H-hydrate dehydratase/NAD(P)H-hydrate epimerase [Paenibacillus odorifer]|uniref:Bifunctional NAD(P)H-hydrate repair enzyme n=1 Tax=Paenibacillus odorifer TaxID=189426 RepID=A0A1R0ZFN1_9BACL|nr:bifunctional ADP-dependent NAD(P)H-hydrate dehydratase/NAD(P)H-hydrate epimerase [Paenibacillus odorifer]OME68919.1 bifunctional ADP-dependent (S)-NAD(P)H-hydrate dehydratase/NAD(P)H-hydrate epimerase [Paenibacillus odorifer]
MYLVTAEQMRRLDGETIQRLGIPAIALMENAGRVIAEEIVALCRRRGGEGCRIAAEWEDAGKDAALAGVAFQVSADHALTLDNAAAERWFILVGKGNNGGDGLAAARYLRETGIAVTLVYAVPPESLSGEAALQRDAAAAMGLPAVVYGRDRLDFAECSGILDALLGTGAAGAPRGAYAELIAAANSSGKVIVSADIPSGLNADTGETHEPCIHASVTVCLAFLKRGLLQYPGAGAAGHVKVRAIGIPSSLAPESGVQVHLLTPEVLHAHLGVDLARRRSPEDHKGTYGHVLLAAGTLRMSGAGLLSARAALRAGCGLVTWALPQKLLPCIIGSAPELMLADVGGNEDGTWQAGSVSELLKLSKERDVLAIGPGLGRFEADTEWLRNLWEGTDCPLVIDADALNILADADYKSWASRRHPVILTPHPGEMARLASITTAEVQRDRISLAMGYAKEHKVTLVLKGAHTVIATPEGQAYVNTTGHPGMGTGGAGDVLTGIISSLLAQGLNEAQSATFGVYLHGLAGERAARQRNNPAAIIAGDIIEAL